MEEWVDDGMVGALGLGEGAGECHAALVEHDQAAVEAFDAERFVGDDDNGGNDDDGDANGEDDNDDNDDDGDDSGGDDYNPPIPVGV